MWFLDQLGWLIYTMQGFSYLEEGMIPGAILTFNTRGVFWLFEKVTPDKFIYTFSCCLTLPINALILALPFIITAVLAANVPDWLDVEMDIDQISALVALHLAQKWLTPLSFRSLLRHYLFRWVASLGFMLLPLTIKGTS